MSDNVNVTVTADTSSLDSALSASAAAAKAAFDTIGASADTATSKSNSTLRQLQTMLEASQQAYRAFSGETQAAIGAYIASLQSQISAMTTAASASRSLGEATSEMGSGVGRAEASMVGLGGAFAGLDRQILSASAASRVFSQSLASTTLTSAELAANQRAAAEATNIMQAAFQESGTRLLSYEVAAATAAEATGGLGGVLVTTTGSLGAYIDALMGVNTTMLPAQTSAAAFVTAGLTPMEEALDRVSAATVRLTQTELQNMNVRLLTTRAASSALTGSVTELGSRVRTVASSDMQALVNQLTGVTTGGARAGGSARSAASGITEVGGAARQSADRASDLAAAFGGVATKAHLTSGAMHEMVVEAHELMTGNFSRMPGTALTLANRMGNLTTNILLTVGAFAALVTAAQSAVEWLNRVQGAKMLAESGGSLYNPQLGRQSIDKLIEDSKEITNLEADEARKIVAEFTRMPGATEPAIRGMMGMVRSLASAGSGSAEQMAREMAESYGRVGKAGEEMISKLQIGNQTLASDSTKTFQQAYREAQQANSPLRQRQVLLEALAAATDKTEKDSPQARNRLSGLDRAASFASSNSEYGGLPDTTPNNQADQEQARRKAARDASVKAAIAQAPDTAAQGGGKSAYVDSQKESLEAQRDAYLQTVNINNMDAHSHQELRLHMAQMDADFWKGALSRTQQGTTEQIAARQQYMEASERLMLQEASLHDRNARAGVAAAKRGLMEQLADLGQQQAAARGNYDEIMRLESERLALIERSVGRQTSLYQNELKRQTELEQQHATEVEKIEQGKLANKMRAYEEDLSAMTKNLNSQRSTGTITRDQEITQLKEFVTKSAAEYLRDLDNFIATLQKGSLEYQKAMLQREAAAKKFSTQSSIFDQQALTSAQKAAQQLGQEFGKVFENIEGRMSSSIAGIIAHTETLGGAMRKIAVGILTDFVNLALKMAAQWVVTQIAMTTTTETQSAVRAAQEAGGSGFGALIAGTLGKWLGLETSKTAITTSGTAQRATVESTGGFVSLLPSFLARWLGLETAKTAATTAQTATRTGVEETGQLTQAATTAAVNATSAVSFAAVGAAAAGASVAAIPITGWALAPEVAAETFGVLGAYAGPAGLATGAWEIPKDMSSTIHKGEMVVPSNFASGLRQSFGTGGSAGGNNLHYSPTINAGGEGGPSLQQITTMLGRTSKDMMSRAIQMTSNGNLSLPGRA